MPFARPTLTEIIARIEGDMSSRITGPSSILRRSMLKILARVYGGAIHLVYGFLSFLKDQLFVTSADDEYLEQQAAEYGIRRKDADKATGEASITGSNGFSVPAGTQLQSPDSQIYITDEEVIISGGIADLSLTAQTGGANGNQDAGTVLTFISPIPGINTSATVDSNGITGGVDSEDSDDLRARTLTRKRQPPHGGASFDYESWALEVPGVTRAWAFSGYYGRGTVGLAFVRDNDENTIIPNSEQREEVRQYIISHTDPLTGVEIGIPLTAEEGFYVLEMSLQSLDFDIDIYPNNATIRSNIEAQLENLIFEKGGPGETIYESDKISYIMKAAGLTASRLNTPDGDTGIAVNKIPVLGTVTFGDY